MQDKFKNKKQTELSLLKYGFDKVGVNDYVNRSKRLIAYVCCYSAEYYVDIYKETDKLSLEDTVNV